MSALRSFKVQTMEVDEVFERIGGFGRSQIIIYFLVNSIHILLGIHTLALAFIGVEPSWTCGSGEQDTVNKCLRYGRKLCTPEYSNDFMETSIVSEVSHNS